MAAAVPDLPTIVAVVGGTGYRWSDDDAALFELLVRYLGAREIWNGGDLEVDRNVDDLARRMDLSVRTFLPDPVQAEHDLPLAIMARNAKMVEDLNHAIFHVGHRGTVVVFPGEGATDNAAGHARRHRIHTIDLRSRPLSLSLGGAS